jgi:hypothetical protein
MAGYSGTPLAKKLGLKEAQHVAFLGEPNYYRDTLGKPPRGSVWVDRLSGTFDLIQLFATTESQLKRAFAQAQEHLAPSGALWISWPKRSSGMDTDLNENVIRLIGLALGLVDVKVCAVDNTWSGLKFVYRLKDRW